MENINKVILLTLIATPLAVPQIVQAQSLPKNVDQKLTGERLIVADLATSSSPLQAPQSPKKGTPLKFVLTPVKNEKGQNKSGDKKKKAASLQATAQLREVIPPTPATQESGHITIQGSEKNYATLEDALKEAKDGAVLEVHGKVELHNDVPINKSITLKAGSQGAMLSTDKVHRTGTASKSAEALSLQVDSGKTLTLGDGTTSELLLDEVHVYVTKGKLVLQDGARINSNLSCDSNKFPKVNNSIVGISGKESSAEFKGGVVENPATGATAAFKNDTIVTIQDEAQVSEISGGTYKGTRVAFNVSDENTKITKITGGTFEQSDWTGLSYPCFKIENKARVDSISGGTFTSYHFGAVQLESGASIGEISAGTFTSLYPKAHATMYSGAIPFCSGLVLYGRNGSSPVVVDKITGGTFTGTNGILSVGSDPKQMAKIQSITGGNFSSIDGETGNAGLYFTQNSEVGEISGNVVATGRNVGIWNAGTIKKISGGTYTGQNSDGLQNVDYSQMKKITWGTHFKGHIEEITGGSFKGKEHGLMNAGVVDTISGGIFDGETNAIACSSKTKKGQLSTIKGGAFYAKKGTAIVLVSPLILEPDLGRQNEAIGVGRYYASAGNAIFNDELKVTYPSYTNKGAKKPYKMSDASDGQKDVASYPDTAFRYLKGPNLAVTFMNDGQPYATVQVEIGKSINSDSLADQKMPANASKDGYLFKEWNTQADGKGTTFDGSTAVQGNMTVYAIYDLQQSVLNASPVLKVTDKTITEGESLDLTSLVTTASDAEDGDLKAKVQIKDGGFDSTTVGTYKITFTLTDKQGAKVTKTATVTVTAKPKPKPQPQPQPQPQHKHGEPWTQPALPEGHHPDLQPQPQPQPVPTPQPGLEPQPMPQPQPQPEPETQLQPELEPQSQPQPTPQLQQDARPSTEGTTSFKAKSLPHTLMGEVPMSLGPLLLISGLCVFSLKKKKR